MSLLFFCQKNSLIRVHVDYFFYLSTDCTDFTVPLRTAYLSPRITSITRKNSVIRVITLIK